MENNRINSQDKFRVVINDENGQEVYTYNGQGVKNLENAVSVAYAAYMGAPAPAERPADESMEDHPSFYGYYANPDRGANKIENYTFIVTNLTNGTEGCYRVNAGGHLNIVPEVKVEG